MLPGVLVVDKDVELITNKNGFSSILLGWFMRFNYYFLIFIPILIPKIVVIAKKQHYKLASFSVTVMCVVFSAYFFINLFAGADILDIYPYIPFWS